MEKIVNKTLIRLIKGDITEVDTEAIVNAANSALVLGGGVAGAIRKKGGPSIQEECNKIGGISVGEAVITTAGNLKCKYVIHAVGPRNGEGDEDRKLKDATINSLKLADEREISSIAFPAISTGIFGFPIDRCAKIMLEATINYVKSDTTLKTVGFCLFDLHAYEIFKEEFRHQLL